MNRRLVIALTALALILACGTPTPTPTSPPPPEDNGGDVTTDAPGSNTEIVEGADGISGMPVNCGNAYGDVYMPKNSFVGEETFTISCVDSGEAQDLDALVKQETGETGSLLGAVSFEPSPFDFDKDVTITIPLLYPRPDLAGQDQDLYYYNESTSNLEYVKKARVDDYGLTAEAKVDHFSTFVLVGPPESGNAEPGFVCSDPLGCVTYEPGQPIRIAALLTYSGENGAALEMSAGNEGGIQRALDEYGDIGGHDFELLTFNDACNPDLALESAERIISDPGIAGVIGTVCSSTAEAAMQYISKYGYSMVSPANTRTSLTAPGSHQDGYLRISAPDSLEARGMAAYAYKELGIRYVSVIYGDSRIARDLAETFSAEFMELGGKLLEIEELVDTSLYLEKVATRIAAGEQQPDAIYMPGVDGSLANTLFLKYYGDDIQFLTASDMTFNSDFIERAGIASYRTHFPLVAPDNFDMAFELGYDAAAMLIDAISRSAEMEDDGTLHIGRQSLRDALYGTSEFAGRTGTFSCDRYGDCSHHMIEIYRYVLVGEFDGKFEEVFSFYP